MNVVLSPKAAKYLKRLNQPIKGRIIEALEDLAKEPPEGDIRAMAGRDGYRLRIGGIGRCLTSWKMKSWCMR